jgi:hypothetical protein
VPPGYLIDLARSAGLHAPEDCAWRFGPEPPDIEPTTVPCTACAPALASYSAGGVACASGELGSFLYRIYTATLRDHACAVWLGQCPHCHTVYFSLALLADLTQ